MASVFKKAMGKIPGTKQHTKTVTTAELSKKGHDVVLLSGLCKDISTASDGTYNYYAESKSLLDAAFLVFNRNGILAEITKDAHGKAVIVIKEKDIAKDPALRIIVKGIVQAHRTTLTPEWSKMTAKMIVKNKVNNARTIMRQMEKGK